MVEKYIWLSMRHFLTNEYRNNIYMGQQQYAICNTDIKTNGLLESLNCCSIFASPLKRSKQTVEFIVRSYTNISFNVVYLNGLMERGLGDFEGKSKQGIRCDPEYFIDNKFIVTKTPPHGESLEHFRNRVDIATKLINAESTINNILVVSHLQTLRMIRFCALDLYNYEIWHSINYNHGEVVQEYYGEK